MGKKEKPFYSERELTEAIEKLKEKALRDLSRFIIGHRIILFEGYWNWMWPELDKELLTYEQKKRIAREFFPLLTELIQKSIEREEELHKSAIQREKQKENHNIVMEMHERIVKEREQFFKDIILRFSKKKKKIKSDRLSEAMYWLTLKKFLANIKKNGNRT
jgi:Fe2+ transport system protein B